MVNEFSRYIGKEYAFGATPTLSNWPVSPTGECISEYAQENILYPRYGDFTHEKTGTGLNQTDVAVSGSPTGWQYQMTDANAAGTSYHSIKFNFTGEEFTLAWGSNGVIDTYYELFVNGVSQGVFSNYAGQGGFAVGSNNRRTHTFDYVRDKVIEIRSARKSSETGTRMLRLEGIIINKKIRVTNQGIIGIRSLVYLNNNLSGGADGEAVGTEDNYVFCMIGANDRPVRSDTPGGSNTFKYNLQNLIDAITPLADLILMCNNPWPAGLEGSSYSFSMQEARNVIYALAKTNTLDMIDHYVLFQGVDLAPYLGNGPHPNNIGYQIMARNIINSLECS